MSEADPREPDDLGPRLRDLAKSQVAPADALDRLRDRLRTNIPALGPSTPPAPPPPSLAAGAGAGKLLFAVAGLLVGAAAGAIVMHEIDRSAPATLAAPTVTSAQESSVRTAPTTIASAPATASATPRPPPKPMTSVDPTATAAPSAVSATNAERLLVDEARAAYARGARNDALDALSRHATRYPNGALVEEREALAVRILVDAGRTAEARARGERFRARYPKSLMLPAVEAALESIP